MRAVFLAVVCLALPVRAEPGLTTLGPEILRMRVLERRAVQGILTPVPVDVELPEAILARARRVLVHYRVWGDPDWTTIELGRSGRRHRGEIPCLEVSTITGDVRFYLRIHDAEGRVIAASGSRASPYRVSIVHDTHSDEATRRPARCPDPADCPPNLPGCGSERLEVPCSTDGDCEGGATCGFFGICEDVDRPRNAVTLGVGHGFGAVATAGACTMESQEREGYACFRQHDGAAYYGRPAPANEPLRVGPTQTRLTLGYERLVFLDASVGARVSWAAAGEGRTAPRGTEFFPLAGELRATRWFGSDPWASRSLRAYAFTAIGAGMFDVRVEVPVREDVREPGLQGGNDLEQTLDVTRRAGDAWIAVGAGGEVEIARPFAFAFELEVLQAFPFPATVVLPSAGGVVRW